MITTTVFEDDWGNEYLLTSFENNTVRLATRPKGTGIWSAPLSITRVERTETE
jgi:hypothetical protein